TNYYQDVRGAWTANNCNTKPVATTTIAADDCQRASDLYTIVAGQSWGSAPPPVQRWWTESGCNTRPLFSDDACQNVSNTLGVQANVTFGAADAYTQVWWTASGCNAA